ncbi:hypothetical protein [Oryzicola mucosus]|uniref:Uncharacterized protein n=1 Tax=Oryzicola mucosus TaxID=2767425 RepID=A0A8J6PNS6_9HYPH|nr:hypothetical protein [Oryzicola mucosus]MBD0415477.1 hypothetical protein [Oryzicola mucosus]MDI6024978.1 hypothetical protein [Tianweitania sp. UT-5YL-CI-8]
MAELHARGVELVSTLRHTADNIQHFEEAEVRMLLQKTAQVLSDLLARDMPSSRMYEPTARKSVHFSRMERPTLTF